VPKPDLRRSLPTGLTGLAGIACLACCAIPLLLAAGVLGGVGWAAFGQFLPGTALALALAVAAGGTWWWASRHRHTSNCAAGDCACAQQTNDNPPGEMSVPSGP